VSCRIARTRHQHQHVFARRYSEYANAIAQGGGERHAGSASRHKTVLNEHRNGFTHFAELAVTPRDAAR
jgi:hypothetical protein